MMSAPLLLTLLASTLAAAPLPGGELLSQLSVFDAKAGTYAEYLVEAHEGTPAMSLRLEVMNWEQPKEKTRRWIVLTAGVGPERVEMWALARRGPNGQPIRERVIVRMRERAMELPGEQDTDDAAPQSASLERKGSEKLKVPAGEFKAERIEVAADGQRLTMWTSTKVPLGGNLGGIVKLKSPAGPAWVLVSSGVAPVRQPPWVTEPAAPRAETHEE